MYLIFFYVLEYITYGIYVLMLCINSIICVFPSLSIDWSLYYWYNIPASLHVWYFLVDARNREFHPLSAGYFAFSISIPGHYFGIELFGAVWFWGLLLAFVEQDQSSPEPEAHLAPHWGLLSTPLGGNPNIFQPCGSSEECFPCSFLVFFHWPRVVSSYTYADQNSAGDLREYFSMWL